MSRKKWMILAILIFGVIFAFLQRDILRIAYLTGERVSFPNVEVEKAGSARIFIVGSEGTISAGIIKGVSKRCPEFSIHTKVNRFTNFAWQEKNELHRFIREGGYDFVLIETDPVDYLKENKDRMVRFETSARKAGSKLLFWSIRKPKIFPDNFVINLPTNLERLCPK